MAQNDQDDAQRLLSLIEGDTAADASLPPGWKWGRLADAGIGGPIADMKPSRRGNKIISLPSRESLATLKSAASLRWPVIERSAEGEAAWSAMSAACMEYQRGLIPAKRMNTVEPAGDDSVSSRPIRIIR
jgi:hypothetical protein